MHTGVVKFFLPEKGYGYIIAEDGNEIFVHFSGILMDGYRTLNKGEKVTFDITTEERGDKAVNVTVIKEEASSAIADEAPVASEAE